MDTHATQAHNFHEPKATDETLRRISSLRPARGPDATVVSLRNRLALHWLSLKVVAAGCVLENGSILETGLPYFGVPACLFISRRLVLGFLARPSSRGSRDVYRLFTRAGVTQLTAFSLYNLRGPSSVLEVSRFWTRGFDWALSSLWKLGPGFRFDLLGLVLVLLFLSRLALGIASLPLALPESGICSSDAASWPRVQRLIWVLVAQTPIALWSFFIGTVLLFVVSSLPRSILNSSKMHPS